MIILYNAKIYSPVQASAIAIRGDRIIALGTDAAIRALADSHTEQIDLKGALVLPGLTDAHLHFEWFSIGLTFVDVETDTIDEALKRVAERAKVTPKGQWIRGHGWNYSRWGDEFPTAAQLDSVAPDHPLYLTAKSMHAAWTNSLGLKISGVTTNTPDPEGGKVGRDAQGNLSGILFETAMDYMTARSYSGFSDYKQTGKIPDHTSEDVAQAMLKGQDVAWKVGLTGVHDFDGVRCFTAYQLLRERGQLGLRVNKNIPVAYLDQALALGLRSGFGDHWLRLGNVKVFMDGALGPRTATMIEPYEGEPNNYGIAVTDKETLYDYGRKAMMGGLAMTVHAIGDKANHDLLDVYEQLRKEEDQTSNFKLQTSKNSKLKTQNFLRHRAEHLQILHPDDMARVGKLKIIGSMQPIHATSDMNMVDKYWGKRGVYSYAWRDQLNNGVVLAFGSDSPVEPINPLWGIHAAVTRRRADGSPSEEGWYAKQKLTVSEAVDGYTKGAAYAAKMEDHLGTIEVGKLADLTIVDRDLFTCDPMMIRDAAVLGTMVGGEFKFRAI
ncbi:MAG: amidohydrolase [Chloroflexota bacterium]|mgnify:CR=1 FL=1